MRAILIIALVAMIGFAGAIEITITNIGAEMTFNGEVVPQGTTTYTFGDDIVPEFTYSTIIRDGVEVQIIGMVFAEGEYWPVFIEGGYTLLQEGDYSPLVDSRSYYYMTSPNSIITLHDGADGGFRNYVTELELLSYVEGTRFGPYVAPVVIPESEPLGEPPHFPQDPGNVL